ncbi:MAG TPA: class II aldolase/adducin family protein [Candidatus Limnocylindrales bacterium]
MADRIDEARLRDALVRAGRRLGTRGLISAGEGNLSIRLPGSRLLVTPSGRRKDELEPGDLIVVPLVADDPSIPVSAPAGLRPTSDLAIHRAVLQARPDATSVAHAHLPATMALTLAGIAPDPTVLPETALFLPRLSVLPYGEPGSTELAGRIAAALTEAPEPFPGALILERHGAVAVGGPAAGGAAAAAIASAGTDALIAALGQAIDRLELVEVLARTWRDAILLRAATGGGYPSRP